MAEGVCDSRDARFWYVIVIGRTLRVFVRGLSNSIGIGSLSYTTKTKQTCSDKLNDG